MQIRLRNRSLRKRRLRKILGALFALFAPVNGTQTAAVPGTTRRQGADLRFLRANALATARARKFSVQ